MTFVFELNIRVMTGLRVQQFIVPMDLTTPTTLEVKQGQFGVGNYISILDDQGQKREWYAIEILGMRFVVLEEDEPPQSAEAVSALYASRNEHTYAVC